MARLTIKVYSSYTPIAAEAVLYVFSRCAQELCGCDIWDVRDAGGTPLIEQDLVHIRIANLTIGENYSHVASEVRPWLGALLHELLASSDVFVMTPNPDAPMRDGPSQVYRSYLVDFVEWLIAAYDAPDTSIRF